MSVGVAVFMAGSKREGHFKLHWISVAGVVGESRQFGRVVYTGLDIPGVVGGLALTL